MPLTQIQIIQSLGESMKWLQKELDWGVPSTELRHLVGRIGELYAAVITNSQMATSVNQKGYDIVSVDHERISVKTKTKIEGAGFVSFNPNTLNEVDRIIILHLDVEEQEINILFNDTKECAEELMNKNNASSYTIAMSKLRNLKAQRKKDTKLVTTSKAVYKTNQINELENGSIQLFNNDKEVYVVKPTLRKIASELNISIYNGNGNEYNTRQLGGMIIKHINSRFGASDEDYNVGVVRDKYTDIVLQSVYYKEFNIKQLSSKAIRLYKDEKEVNVVRPVLREIAFELNMSIYNSKGNEYNTQQLGYNIIKKLLK